MCETPCRVYAGSFYIVHSVYVIVNALSSMILLSSLPKMLKGHTWLIRGLGSGHVEIAGMILAQSAVNAEILNAQDDVGYAALTWAAA